MISLKRWWICSRGWILTRYLSHTFKGNGTSADGCQALAAAGITPDSSKTYTSSEIQSALTKLHGAQVYLGCHDGALNEVWYFFNVRGNVIDGQYQAATPRE